MTEALTVRGLSVRLGQRTVLHELTFSAHYGELLAVLGPNGAGKSTLLRACCGLLAGSGQVELDGSALHTLAAAERARRVSFVPQQSRLTAALSVRQVVSLGRYVHRAALSRLRHEDERAIDRAMRDADVAGLAERSFSDLSSGEQKRVLIARALCTEARTLLLDEPTAALDIEHALRLFAQLRELASRGRAVVVVLHQLEHALSFCDRALLLSAGRLLALGPSREVLTRENVLALHRVELVPDQAPDFRLPEAP